MHIYHGTDLKLSPTTTVIVFQVTKIPVYKKAVSTIGSFQRYALYRDIHGKSPHIPRRQGCGLRGFQGSSSAELESSTDPEFSPVPDTSKPKQIAPAPPPHPDGQEALTPGVSDDH